MTGKSDREAALKNFGNALAWLMSAAMAEMPEEKIRMVGAALASGKATVQLAINTAPALIIVAYLRTNDDSEPMHEMFRIDTSSPSAAAH